MQISTLFDQDAKRLNGLVALLLKEQESLVKMDIDDVEQVLDEKSILIQQIADATKIRHQALGAAGFDANENGMATWVRGSESTQMHTAWESFQDQLAKAKELNRVNGQMINQHFKRNQQAINTLQGKAPNAASGVYGPNGQTTNTSHARSMLSV